MDSSPTSTNGSLSEPEIPTLPKPQITWKGVGLAAVFWFLLTILYTLLIAQEEGAELSCGLFIGQVIFIGSLALWSLPVWWLTVREMDRVHWAWVALTHLAIAPVYAWVSIESAMLVVELGYQFTEAEQAQFSSRYHWILFFYSTLYAIQFSIYHLVRNVQRMRMKEQQATELMARAREQELAALKAQINPHFLFNTLNSISATLRRDPHQAREMIAKLAGMMRYTLDSSDRDLVPLREEIDFTRQYLDLEGHRFSDRLDARVRIDASDDALDAPVPPMVLQPLVENALRHGIAPSESGGTVEVHISTLDDRIQVQVSDTGVGPDGDVVLSGPDGGTGLVNASTRLEHTYGSDATLHTAPNEPTGFTVSFSIPRNGTPAVAG